MSHKKWILDSFALDDLTNRLVARLNSWDQLRSDKKDFPVPVVYGVPRGGINVALLVTRVTDWKMTYTLSKANCVVDDIIDSGITMKKVCDDLYHKKPGTRYSVAFDALVRDQERDYFGHHKEWVVFPWDVTYGGQDKSQHDIPLRFLEAIGEDPSREGLVDTPKRIVKSWGELYGGYQQDPKEILGRTFENTVSVPGYLQSKQASSDKKLYDEMVILDNIEFYSTCEHHALPFFGRAHVGYIPGDRVVGISKIARLVDCFSQRLQIQERLTDQIADAIQKYLQPVGVGVLLEAQHFCMVSRGVKKYNSIMKTSSMHGAFRKPEARAEFLSIIRG